MPQPWTIRREVDLARDFVGVERIAALFDLVKDLFQF